MTAKSIEQVLQEHTKEWMSMRGVVGTAIAEIDGEPCLRVLTLEKTPELLSLIPSRVDGFLVDIQATGPFRALGEPDSQE